MPTGMSGVAVSVEAKLAYDEVKREKRYRYIIYSIKNETVIDVETKGDRAASYKDFLAEMEKHKDQCRYCLFDFPIGTSDQAKSPTIDRLVLIAWCPGDSTIRQKVLYTTSYDGLKKALVGVYKYIQACNVQALAQEEIEDALKRK